MEQLDIEALKTNEEFLKELSEKEARVLEGNEITSLYEVLDALMIIDADVNRINRVFIKILEITFEALEQLLKDKKEFDLNNENLLYLRALYENGIERWNQNEIQNAEDLFLVLSYVCADDYLSKVFDVHLISLLKKESIDKFYADVINHEATTDEDMKYAYFLHNFSVDIDAYIEENIELLNDVDTRLKSLVEM